MPTSDFSECVVEIVRKIPRGKVATYGCIAKLAGAKKPHRTARAVGQALYKEKGKGTIFNWHRVVSKNGKIRQPDHEGERQQRQLLEQEGIEFESDKIDLRNHLWEVCR